jgi:hypothetical protein
VGKRVDLGDPDGRFAALETRLREEFAGAIARLRREQLEAHKQLSLAITTLANEQREFARKLGRALEDSEQLREFAQTLTRLEEELDQMALLARLDGGGDLRRTASSTRLKTAGPGTVDTSERKHRRTP